MATNHELTLYVMTGCPYCIKVKRFLADNGVTIPERNISTDPEAEQILEELLPQFLYETDEADAEAMSKSILDAKTRASIFRMPTENYDLAIERICKLRISLTEN